MSNLKLDVWVARDFPRTWSHVVKGSFADPQRATQGATDLFCYDKDAGLGAFFATVRNGRLDNGSLAVDGPRQVGPSHAFSSPWTHVVHVPVSTSKVRPFPLPPILGVTNLVVFYDAISGVGEIHQTDSRGGLVLRKRHTGWRTTWAQIVVGRFGKANLFFYDPTSGTGEFHALDSTGGMKLIRSTAGFRSSWARIVAGDFTSSKNDDLLFYDRDAGVGAFYKVDASARPEVVREHTNWRSTWAHIVPGRYRSDATFDGVLFREEESGHTEFYGTDGNGGMSAINIDPANQWFLPWRTILSGEFTPNIGLIGTSRLCCYDAVSGALLYFFIALN